MGKDKLTLWEVTAVGLGNIIGVGNPHPQVQSSFILILVPSTWVPYP